MHSFNTQPREGGCVLFTEIMLRIINVSTHSHPKVAADLTLKVGALMTCFNTQPPEGGCLTEIAEEFAKELFQHTAARRRLRYGGLCHILQHIVSTHSRAEAAATAHA